jgi:hypothetical protein
MFSARRTRIPNLPEVSLHQASYVVIAACRLSGRQYFHIMRSVHALRTNISIIIIIIIIIIIT